jgi:hypothetical protein
VVDVSWIDTDTSGGARERAVNELAASPTGRPPRRAASAITPVGKLP